MDVAELQMLIAAGESETIEFKQSTAQLARVGETLCGFLEAVVNALCHRTYTHPGGAVSVAIFDDRLEIWSDGTLPFGLRPEDLKQDHPSRPRNPLITSH